jgi:hypothetical protein
MHQISSLDNQFIGQTLVISYYPCTLRNETSKYIKTEGENEESKL